ncbi:hypothetical protein IQ07DRAFT_607278 [Pyrenochaeta sp. DS3sAY3a]|nr:hypothetical protein IQ07DRAFT_607278 [Pyrenochaeta sp. DS3sAY3a]
MSFLFGKKNKQQQQQPAGALPAATRDITSSHGQGPPPAALNGIGVREVDKSRGGPPAQTPTPGGSVNNSLSSLQNQGNSSTPEPKALRDRGDSNPQNANGRAAVNSPDSPYPWSSRRLNFTGGNPFPRYGAAINSTASKDGTIYLMGGLVGGATVKGDLWLTEMGNGSLACYPISTTGDGPGPRVGHASLLVGNAFIVFGGDTKLADNDDLDDTLYLLNTSTKHWSRALPQGPRPTGRYGHTLNILSSKIYIFGGQVEGFFFNDLVAFDLNSLQSSASRWEVLLPNSKDQASPQARAPPARTNHSVVTWNDKLYLFGGTDGVTWFNDVWTYEPRTNLWTELDCIGYIPVAREGHSAALVNDTMYIFGGRTQDGVDLGDLAAFRISSRRWYMFQNMGHSPSARSGHSMTAFGKHVVVLAGEPSSSVSDRNELSMSYILDTSKIRYPPNESALPQQAQQAQNAPRKLSGGERSNIPQGKAAPPARESMMPGSQLARSADNMGNGGAAGGSRLPRAAGQGPPGPPPLQQPPQPRMNGPNSQPNNNSRSRTPTNNDRMYGPPLDTGVAPPMDRENLSPTTRDSPSTEVQRKASDAISQRTPKESMDTTRSGSIVSRNTSRSHKQQHSQDSMEQAALRRSLESQHQHPSSREVEHHHIDSGLELARELEELALARKAGYNVADAFREEDRPLIEALLKMKTELEHAARRIAEVERQRDAAVSEAIYAKTKLAAHGGGSHNGTPQPDGARSVGTPDMDRVQDINRRLAASVEQLSHQNDAEKKAKRLAEDTAETAQKRAQELDSTRQKAVAECESLRAELHEAERIARDLLALDKQELSAKVARISEESKNHSSLLQSLRDAVVASSEKSTLLEKKLEDERYQSEILRQKLSQLRTEHEAGVTELETAILKVRDAEELAEKHAEEARHHRQAVLSGLGSMADRSVEKSDSADEPAKVLTRKNQSAADQASEKLRRAEERIAGLEAYQEQSSREGLTIRKQLQHAMRDAQASEAEKSELRQQHERLRLDSNAFEERDSPSSRFGTPELNRVRELEQQVDSMNKAHEEMRAAIEEREQEALHNDHQAAVKYLRGTEKMLAKMKQELDRYKTANSRLEEELALAKQNAGSLSKEQTAGWEAERSSLRQELSVAQDTLKTTVARLESQLAQVQSDLASAREEAVTAKATSKQAESAATQSHNELESLRRQYTQVEDRAREAESRVQMFLDQFETSVDNYRRQSQVPADAVNGAHHRQRAHDSVASAESLYSDDDGTSTPEANNRPSSSGTRNSMALDNLASELDALRSHWETTNKAYRLSDRFDFERTPITEKNEMNDSLLPWGVPRDSERKMSADSGKKDMTSTRPDAAAGPSATQPVS